MKATYLRNLVLLACTLAPCLCAAQDQPYWPFKVGNTWTLDTKVGSKDIVQVVTVTKSSTTGSRTTARLTYRSQGKLLQTEIYNQNAAGLWRVAAGVDGSGKLTPPIRILQLPRSKGQSWNWKGTVNFNGTDVNGEATISDEGVETVTTPAGTFKGVKIHMDLTVMGGGQTLRLLNDYWFAKGVGLVKQVADFGQVQIVGTLQSYKLK